MLNTTLLVSAFHACPSAIRLDYSRDSQEREISAMILSMVNNDNGQDIVPPSSSDEDKAMYKELQHRYYGIEVEKTRNSLEKQHTQSFLKKRPVKLPYKQARQWVQDNLGVNTKEEFEDFVAMGYIQTPYISKYPEEYYTRTGEWISWDHFLNDSIAIQPQRGIFD